MKALALLPIALVTCVLQAQSVPGNTIDDPETYAVYAAVLATRWPFPQTPRTPDATIALDVKTASRPVCETWKMLSGGWSSVIESYSRANAGERWLLPNVNLGVGYLLVDSAEYEKLLMEASGDVRNIYNPFWGDTSFAVSAVGFDAARARAIVALQYSGPAGGSGGGRLFLLEKTNGRWTLSKLDVPACEWTAR